MAEVVPFKPKADFNELTKNVRDGRWVALSSDETRLVAQADTFQEAESAAKEAGEEKPVFFRIHRQGLF